MLEKDSDEMAQEIEKEPLANDALEKSLSPDESEIAALNHNDEQGNPIGESSDDMQRRDYWDRDNMPANPRSNDFQPTAVAEETLSDKLLEQLRERQDLNEVQLTIGEYIIGNIDGDGYLRTSSAAIASDIITRESIGVTYDDVEHMVAVIQQLDPPGVAARSVKECLALQTQRSEHSAAKTALEIIENCFEDLASHNYAAIKQQLGLSQEQFNKAHKFIQRHLHPKPGAGISGDYAQQIRPEFVVTIDDYGKLHVTMPNKLPRLVVSQSVEQALAELEKRKNNSEKDKAVYLNYSDKYTDAKAYIGAIEERQKRLQSIMSAIVKAQNDFFHSEDIADLKPLVLDDIAQTTGYDKSTISRAKKNKWVELPSKNVMPLDFFFSEGINTAKGVVSNRVAKERVKELIDNENKANPLSDDAICKVLKQDGFAIERRTVAKYRSEMGIGASKERKITL